MDNGGGFFNPFKPLARFSASGGVLDTACGGA
jgi:hypothetical protein